MADIIQSCLSLAPVPYLSVAFSVLNFIWLSVQQVKASKEQLRVLTSSIAQLLKTLNAEYSAGRLLESQTSKPLLDLGRLLEEVKVFIRKQISYSFLKSLYVKDERLAQIDGYHRRIGTLINSFQISALLSIQDWQSRNDEARVDDQEMLVKRLGDLEVNQSRLMDALDAQQNNITAMMASLQKSLDQQIGGARERQFFFHSLQYLSTASGSQIKWERWMVTSFEVDFDNEIGSGGFGRIYKGNWNKTQVALKVLKSEGGVTPSSTAIRREIDTWAKMMHPHILQFLGANVLDDRPFIVMPYMKNGNAREYIQKHPDCNRLKLLYHISLGLIYLHSQKIVHGDLKAFNVLIDDAEKAVLCDFGLTQVKADVTSRTSKADATAVTGSRNWMAPERLLGGSLKKPCDIYAYGMTIYEIYANEIPLAHIGYLDFIELVAERGVRPERPDEDDAPQLSEDIWKLAESCWAKDPLKRPSAAAVCDIVYQLLESCDSVPGAKPLPARRLTSESPPPPYQPGSPQLALPSNRATVSSLHSNPSLVSTQPSSRIEQSTLLAPQPDPSPVVQPVSVPPDRPGLPTHHSEPSPKSTLPASHSPSNKPQPPHVKQSAAPIPVPRPSSRPVVDALPPSPKSYGPLEWRAHHTQITAFAFSPDRRRIASGSVDRTIRIWDSETGNSVSHPFKGCPNEITSIAFSPDGLRIVAGIKYHRIRIQLWDVNTGQVISGPQAFTGHTMTVNSVAYSPDGTTIISGSADKTIRTWHAESGEPMSEPFVGHSDSVVCVAYSSDGRRIASSSSDSTIRIWDIETGKLVVEPLKGHNGTVWSVLFSSDGQRVFSGADDHSIRVWDASAGEPAMEAFYGHMYQVKSIALSPDNSRIISRSIELDNQIRVWDAQTGKLVSTLFKGNARDVISCVTFSPEGRRVLSGSSKGILRVHPLE